MNKYLIIYFAIILFCYSCNSQEQEDLFIDTVLSTKSGVTHQVWQDNLNDTIRVANLLLPGTHDSGAYVRGGSLIETQRLSFQEQLNIGIRAFDIRLRATNDNKLEIYHGIAAQGIYFQENVLKNCINFLKKNPSEFLVFSLKKEGSNIGESKGYNTLLKEVFSKSEYKDFFYSDFKRDIRISELRGKILILHRSWINANIGGDFHNWRDNASFQAKIVTYSTDKSAPVFVEDCYKVSTLFHIQKKWKVIKENLELSASNPNDWFITFSSGTGVLAHPISISKRINPKLSYLIENQHHFKGILFTDFIDKDLANVIIRSNFK